jgi:ArsR family transcriptional regulator
MIQVTDISRALSDANRVRAVSALRGRELCVCQIVELLELAPSTVSKHLSILRQAGLVESRKNGRWVYYRRPGAGAAAPVRDALAWVDAALEGSAALSGDDDRIARILEIPVEQLCTTDRN